MFRKEFQNFIDVSIIQEKFLNFLYSLIIANIEKIQILKSKILASFDSNELIDYKINLQVTFSHQNMAYIDNDVKVLLQLFKNNSTRENENVKKIFEIDQKNLDYLITKLKEITNKIKV